MTIPMAPLVCGGVNTRAQGTPFLWEDVGVVKHGTWTFAWVGIPVPQGQGVLVFSLEEGAPARGIRHMVLAKEMCWTVCPIRGHGCDQW